MPYEVEKDGEEYVVVTKDTGKVHARERSKAEAEEVMKALYANSGDEARETKGGLDADHPIDSLASGVVAFGSEVKTLDDAGIVGGLLVRFGDPSSADRSHWKDFFTPDTDFGVELPVKTTRVLYLHGLTKGRGKRSLGRAELTADPSGIAIKARLDMADPFVRERLWPEIKANRIGWSSGSANHAVERESAPGGSHRVTYWPIAEPSLTPMPADPRNVAHAIKSLVEIKAMAEAGEGYAPPNPRGELRRGAVVGGLDRLHSATHGLVMSHLHDERLDHAGRMAACKGAYGAHQSAALRMIDSMMKDTGDDVDDAYKSIVRDYVAATFSRLTLTDHIDWVADAVKSATDRLHALAAVKHAEGRSFSAARMAEIESFAKSLASLVAESRRPTEADDALIARKIEGVLARTGRLLYDAP